MGWLDVGTFWHIVTNFCMWFPYCVLLPLWLRRSSGISIRDSFWFKYNVYMFVWCFYATYYHTEYFFDLLHMHYRFPDVTLLFDSALIGPDETTAAAAWQKVPVGMYFNTVGFWICYHTPAIVLMRRVRRLTLSWSGGSQRLAWVAIVLVTALFFAWGETYFYFMQWEIVKNNVWYENMSEMLRVGSIFYSMYFIVSFPNAYRLDENPDEPGWSVSRVVIEASFVGIASMTLLDLWANFIGPIST